MHTVNQSSGFFHFSFTFPPQLPEQTKKTTNQQNTSDKLKSRNPQRKKKPHIQSRDLPEGGADNIPSSRGVREARAVILDYWTFTLNFNPIWNRVISWLEKERRRTTGRLDQWRGDRERERKKGAWCWWWCVFGWSRHDPTLASLSLLFLNSHSPCLVFPLFPFYSVPSFN